MFLSPGCVLNMILKTRSLIDQIVEAFSPLVQGIHRSINVESDVGDSFEIFKIGNQHVKLFTYTFCL